MTMMSLIVEECIKIIAFIYVRLYTSLMMVVQLAECIDERTRWFLCQHLRPQDQALVDEAASSTIET